MSVDCGNGLCVTYTTAEQERKRRHLSPSLCWHLAFLPFVTLSRWQPQPSR